jgi:hypothetical protein
MVQAEGEGEMTRPGAHGADSSSMIVAVVFLVLAALAGALLALNLTVRKKDVIQGMRIDGPPPPRRRWRELSGLSRCNLVDMKFACLAN